ncbi:MAG: MgtC/SapB family protein [Prevotella sp.]|jgi:putative Mg2+ transporter-C (MgtC) family protein|nr:MgtC/SapB family protein [Prevotella sp.]MBQ6187869.1 MgtC/SapB family protein [Prevotella sp.]
METDFILRLLIATLCGGIIGLEREYRAKEAGFRTHFLVALGSCLFTIISINGFTDVVNSDLKTSFDPSRIASQIVTGIGFIGAGTIIFQKHVIRGLTTASGLWVTAAIGMACGSGMYEMAIATTILVWICLELLYILIHRYGKRNTNIVFSSPNIETATKAINCLREKNSDRNPHVEIVKDDKNNYNVTIGIWVKRKYIQENTIGVLTGIEGVEVLSIG